VDLGLRGKVALVAGGSEGLGFASARALAREGVRLGIVARRPDKLTEATLAISRETGAEVQAFPADVTDRDQAAAAVAGLVERLGAVQILVANAGGPKPGSFADLDWTAWTRAFVQVVGPVHHLISAVIPSMKEAGWGRIVSIQSMSIRQPVESLLLSNSLRPAAAGLIKGLAGELAPFGITLNVVGPGPCRTGRILELGRHRHPGRGDEEITRALGESVPIGRLVEPDEVGAAVTFLCSVQAASITGTYLPVDGGSIRGQM
jgi:3-oxoacyl-[acyl-carrier protein] reductase